MNFADYLVLIIYFSGMAGIGIWAMRQVKGQEDFFMGGRKFGKLFQTFAPFCIINIKEITTRDITSIVD